MVKKRILEAELTAAGWTKMDHKNGKHDKWTKPGMRPIMVSRGGSGSEIKEYTANAIRKEAGLR